MDDSCYYTLLGGDRRPISLLNTNNRIHRVVKVVGLRDSSVGLFIAMTKQMQKSWFWYMYLLCSAYAICYYRCCLLIFSHSLSIAKVLVLLYV